MTWTWTRIGPREWRVERSPEPSPAWGGLGSRLPWANVTPEEMAEFYARNRPYYDPQPMTDRELIVRNWRIKT